MNEDLTTLSFGTQAVRLIESDPFKWHNAEARLEYKQWGILRYRRREFFTHELLGRFRVDRKRQRLTHLGIATNGDPQRPKDEFKVRFHVRQMSIEDQQAAFVAYIAWSKRALNLNALPMHPGSVIWGP